MTVAKLAPKTKSKPRPVGRPVGRPSLSGSGAAARIEIKLAPRDRQRWQAAAESRGVTLAVLVRETMELAIAGSGR